MGQASEEVLFGFSVKHRGVANLISLVRLQAPRRSNRVSYSSGHSLDANSGHEDPHTDFGHRIIQTALAVCTEI